jgi:rod shape-determining protein MreD
MIDQLNPRSRRDAFGSKINRDHSPVLMHFVPWASIMLFSLSTMLPIISPTPLVPPMAYLLMLAWRMLRPGLLPLWAGFPLGLFDDVFSGQPIGSGILLFSLTLIALDLLEVRFPWRGFWQNWMIAAAFLAGYVLIAAVVSGAPVELTRLVLLVPQILFSVFAVPVAMALVGVLDRLRLIRFRTTF